jgi:preprotein translocase subunit SecD
MGRLGLLLAVGGLALVAAIGVVIAVLVADAGPDRSIVAGDAATTQAQAQGAVIAIFEAADAAVTDTALEDAAAVMRERLDELGLTEASLLRQGDRIEVRLPGDVDADAAVDVIGRSGSLQFRRVLEVAVPGTPAWEEIGPPFDVDQGPPPAGEEVVLRGNTRGEDGEPLPAEQQERYRLASVALDGSGVTDATATPDQFGVGWQVTLDLDRGGASAFAQVTGELACEPEGSPARQLAIVLDGIVESAPTMSPDVVCGQGITGGSAIITTGGGEVDATALALVLRTGTLPVPMRLVDLHQVPADPHPERGTPGD